MTRIHLPARISIAMRRVPARLLETIARGAVHVESREACMRQFGLSMHQAPESGQQPSSCKPYPSAIMHNACPSRVLLPDARPTIGRQCQVAASFDSPHATCLVLCYQTASVARIRCIAVFPFSGAALILLHFSRSAVFRKQQSTGDAFTQCSDR